MGKSLKQAEIPDGLDPSKFTPCSGTMRIKGSEAARELGIQIKGGRPDFNAWAAAISIKAVDQGILSKEEYEKTYGITLEQGRALRRKMYPDLER